MVQGERIMTSNIDNDKARKSFNKFDRRQIMELDTCAHCALCTDDCPTYKDSKVADYSPGVRASKALRLYNKQLDIWAKLFGPRKINSSDINELRDSVFNCTLCGRCMETCPFGFQTHELWVRIREVIHDLVGSPPNVGILEGMLQESQNPYGLDPDMRLDWADFTDLEEIPEKDRAEVAYFVGCTTAFKGINHIVAFSTASLLNRLGVDWTLLGEDEWCCGSPMILAGDLHGAKKYAEHNVELLKLRGVKKVITSCAGCFRVFKWEYPKLLGKKPGFEVVHASEFLRDKLNNGALKVEPVKEKTAYHDPCELSRLGGLIKAPREALKYLTEYYIELPENGLDVSCCGGGGLLQTVNNELRLAIIKRRLDQAKNLGVEILVSSCPACKLAFVDGIREFGYNIEVLDIMELASRQLGLI
jgi:heterodisulfide reductase subunit D